jgi:hypothetical protein
MADDLEATWKELEAIGRETGHVLCRCPSCGGQVMVSILNASGTSRWVKSGGGWPRCQQCRAGSPLGRRRTGVRVEPIGDVALVARVRPGHPPKRPKR